MYVLPGPPPEESHRGQEKETTNPDETPRYHKFTITHAMQPTPPPPHIMSQKLLYLYPILLE